MAKAMTIRLSEEQAEQLEAVAAVEGIPVSRAVRQAIDGHIEARRQDLDFQRRLKASIERNQKILERLTK
ncbi:MAG: ribbon-helix-helix protein, CopG family [Thermoleophilia bacterium]|nr:ribbon-helix-helix protein, CopG family [Thermoleophilia bacterium]